MAHGYTVPSDLQLMSKDVNLMYHLLMSLLHPLDKVYGYNSYTTCLRTLTQSNDRKI